MYKKRTTEAKKVKRKTYRKKKQAEKIEVLDGQVTVEEVLQQEKTDVEAVVEATGCTVEKAEEVLEYAINCNKNNPIGFTIKAINEGWKLKNKETNEINPRSFNNFEPKQYDYDKLEAMLLGHEEYKEDDIHEVLSSLGVGNYTSNNSKRFNGIKIGANVAV